MKKIILIVSVFILILTTSFIKNSTKKIEDQIFLVNENISSLRIELGEVLLEYNYLSSPLKLIQYQSQYFGSDLKQKDITKIKNLTQNNNQLIITDFIKKLENDE